MKEIYNRFFDLLYQTGIIICLMLAIAWIPRFSELGISSLESLIMKLIILVTFSTYVLNSFYKVVGHHKLES